jgi:hypothetical protein
MYAGLPVEYCCRIAGLVECCVNRRQYVKSDTVQNRLLFADDQIVKVQGVHSDVVKEVVAAENLTQQCRIM